MKNLGNKKKKKKNLRLHGLELYRRQGADGGHGKGGGGAQVGVVVLGYHEYLVPVFHHL